MGQTHCWSFSHTLAHCIIFLNFKLRKLTQKVKGLAQDHQPKKCHNKLLSQKETEILGFTHKINTVLGFKI